MWWTAPINAVVPTVNLPTGTFFAAGTGGQCAFVVPAHDLVVIHNAQHPDGAVDTRTVGRFLWLVFDAARLPDIGSDAAIEAARGVCNRGDQLARLLTGRTLLYGEAAAPRGPYRMQLNTDGSAAFLRGSERVQIDCGKCSMSDAHDRSHN
jgi:CubicO group peptidase (beta-lactamase class C family)